MQLVAFMRGLNVGGHRVTNDVLADVFCGVGASDPTPYQASGNVVFVHDADDMGRLEHDLASALEQQLGYGVPTMVRTAAEVRQLADAQPFNEQQLTSTAGKVQVAVLAHQPSTSQRADVGDLVPDGEAVRFDHRVMYWLPLNGISDSTFPTARAERVLGTMTVRTQATLQRIATKFL